MPPSDRATVSPGNFRNIGDQIRSAAQVNNGSGRGDLDREWRVRRRDVELRVRSEVHAQYNAELLTHRPERVPVVGVQRREPEVVGVRPNVKAWHLLAATRRASATSAATSQNMGTAMGISRPGSAPHHASMCQSLYA